MTNESLDEMEPQSQSTGEVQIQKAGVQAKELPGQNLPEEIKQKINSTLKTLEQVFDQWDVVKAKGHTLEMFIESFAAAIATYEDLVKNGTEPQRGKFLVMMNIRKALVQIAENDLKKKQ